MLDVRMEFIFVNINRECSVFLSDMTPSPIFKKKSVNSKTHEIRKVI